MNEEILERRYRALLRAYPADYRRERGDELLDLLLAGDHGRRWPSPRQARALIRGGLRVRAGSTTRRPAATAWWQGIHLAALAVLSFAAATIVRLTLMWIGPLGLSDVVAGRVSGPYLSGVWLPLGVAPTLLFAAALAALVAGRTVPAAGLTAAAGIVPTLLDATSTIGRSPQVWILWWAPALAVLLILLGLCRPADVPRVGRGTGWLVVAVVGGITLVPRWLLPMPLILAAAVLLLAAMLWLGTADPRLLVAAATLSLLRMLTDVSVYGHTVSVLHARALGFGAVAVVLILTVAVQTRRHARI
ncbi:hypothetical protein R8Z50_11480 [Longispora sp. K20-0274]|uniref:hypothetical protein n=1 Tax=Longispora sp. K20-0274 TaxID=3088255 RepID=UPI00399AD279